MCGEGRSTGLGHSEGAEAARGVRNPARVVVLGEHHRCVPAVRGCAALGACLLGSALPSAGTAARCIPGCPCCSSAGAAVKLPGRTCAGCGCKRCPHPDLSPRESCHCSCFFLSVLERLRREQVCFQTRVPASAWDPRGSARGTQQTVNRLDELSPKMELLLSPPVICHQH